jgi:hypothetical protein
MDSDSMSTAKFRSIGTNEHSGPTGSLAPTPIIREQASRQAHSRPGVCEFQTFGVIVSCMKDNKCQKQSWLGRFCQRGGLTLSFAIAVAPFIFYVFHCWWGFDWFYTVLLGAVASVAVGHTLLFPCVFLPFVVWATFHRGLCPHCGRRGLKGGLMAGDASLHNGDTRDFIWSECHYCHHQFHKFNDQSIIHIPPDDPRYT